MVRDASARLDRLGRGLWSFRSSLAGRIATRLAVVSLVMLLVAAVGLGMAARSYVDGLVQSKVMEGERQAETELRDIEGLLVGSARQLAAGPALAEVVSGGDAGRLRANAIAMDVGQDFEFVWVVGSDGTPIVQVGNVGPATITDVVAAARARLESSAIEAVGERHWLLAAALYRSPVSPDRTAVVVIGQSLEGAHISALGRAEGMTVAFGPPQEAAAATAYGRGGFTYVTRHGAPVGVVVTVATEPFEDVLPRTLQVIGLGGSLASVVIVALAVGLVRAGLRPFDLLARAATAAASGVSAEPVPERGPDDVVAVATAFNTMVGAVADREAQLRRMYEASKEEAAAAQHRATHDALTDLPNRVVLRDELERAVGGPPFALLMLDLDDFKDVNDTFGHAVGDRVLALVGERLRGKASEDMLVTRLGGDEFAILVRRAGASAAIRAAREILESFAEPFAVQHEPFSVGGTFGIALYPLHGSDPSKLLRHADVAMYQAKVARTGYHVYDATDDPDPSRRMGLAAALRTALERGELSVAYQPVVDLRSRRIVHVEALARWNSPHFGAVPPAEFIAVAEHTGTIRPLTGFVLRTALVQSVRWRAEGLHVPVAVNVSVRALMDPQFPANVRSSLPETGAVPEDLICEITESVVMSERRRALAAMAAMSDLGVRWSLDDFGTGYSSLSLLHELPLDEIKIDQSFVARAVSDKGSAEIVRATIQIARAFGIRVIAEGIEDEPTATMIADLGCELGQGFLFGRPGPASDIAARVAAAGGLAPSVGTRYA